LRVDHLRQVDGWWQHVGGRFDGCPECQPAAADLPNTTFRDGIENTFSVSSKLVKGHYPLYVSWRTSAPARWSAPIQANDNASTVDEFQPNLTVAADGTASNAFDDRRLACPAAETTEAANAGIGLDLVNPNYSGGLPPCSASNYCVNASVQHYTPTLSPIGHNIRLTQHT